MSRKDNLYKIAYECRMHAYAPYSGFKVGAAILSENNKIFCGCNVENVSYPCGICAEAGAISALIAGGEHKIKEILIVADTDCILPCGNCLQKIAEFADEETLIHSANLQGIVKTSTFVQLFPCHFKKGDIKNA